MYSLVLVHGNASNGSDRFAVQPIVLRLIECRNERLQDAILHSLRLGSIYTPPQ